MNDRENLAHVREADFYSFDMPPLPEFVVDTQKKKVYLDEAVWVLNNGSHTTKIKWEKFPIKNPLIVWSLRLYLSYMIRSVSAAHVSGTYQDVATIKAIYDGKLDESTIFEVEHLLPLLLNGHLGYLTQQGRRYRFSRVRQWFVWCANMYIPGFSKIAAAELMEVVPGGNKKGQAVLSHHVTKGAYQPVELLLVREALRRHANDSRMLKGILLAWLYLALGCNSKNLALLREEDFSHNTVTNEYLLRVPRIKKRGVTPRADFKERRLNPELGELVELLINCNKTEYPILEEGCARPLFISSTYREEAIPGTNQEYRRHMDETCLRELLKNTFNKLKIVSPVTGKPLQVHPRRFRYTFGTIAASQGMPMRVLADLMDHSDLQHVEVYYQAGAEYVTKLNATYAEKLAPLVDLFMGRISELPRNMVSEDKLIFGLPSMLKISTIGHCASDKVCKRMPPRACYVCDKFRAFSDADHRGCMNAMIEERNHRYKGEVGVDAHLDDAVIACARLIRRVEALECA